MKSQSEVCNRYQDLYIGVVCDAMYELGLSEPLLPSYLRPLLPNQRMVGFAHTVVGAPIEPIIPWDDGVERIASYLNVFEKLERNSVLVSVNHDSIVGHFGELTANAAQAKGCSGVLLDGNLRDVEGLKAIGFQAFFRDLSPMNAIGRWEMIGHQIPVEIGDITLHPGDLIFAEFEGVLVVPQKDLITVLEKAETIYSAETLVRIEMQRGVTPAESFNRHGHI